MKNQLCEFYIAGVQHHQAKAVLKDLKVNDFLSLVAEPTNRFDPNAVKIEFITDNGPVMLGYVPMKQDLSAKVSASMTIESLYCKLTEVNPKAKPWEQLKVEIFSYNGIDDLKDEV